MKRKIIGIFVCMLLIGTVLPVSSSIIKNEQINLTKPNKISNLNNKNQDFKKYYFPDFPVMHVPMSFLEPDKIANSNSKGLVFRELVRGIIKDLNVEGNTISFFAIRLRGIGFVSSGGSGFFWYHRYRKMSMSYTGLEFHGILRPRIIWGIFSGTI